MDLARRLADVLRRIREDAGLSQVEMAKKLRISRATLNRLESASQNTTLKILGQICRSLKCEPGELLGSRPARRARRASREDA